jgi:hypothetical protein
MVLNSPVSRPVFSGLVVLALTVVSPVVKTAQTVWLMTFTIDNLTGAAVSGDGLGIYRDYRLESQPGENYCVEASPTNTLLFIRLNRKLDGDSGTRYCGLNGGSPRQFYIAVNNASACSELWSHGYLTDSVPPTSCVIGGLDKPRIRISSDLYAKQTTTTPVAFLTESYDTSRTSYEVRAVTNAMVIKPGDPYPSMRLVQYSGYGRLVRFEPGARAKEVADPFPMPFQMTFTRQ